jgi:hypothetical protein
MMSREVCGANRCTCILGNRGLVPEQSRRLVSAPIRNFRRKFDYILLRFISLVLLAPRVEGQGWLRKLYHTEAQSEYQDRLDVMHA